VAARKSGAKPRADEVGDEVQADDGLSAVVVNNWTEDKHHLLRKYLELQAKARINWLGPGSKGATYIDLFCGTGRSRVIGRTSFIDGSPVLAWKASQDDGAPFTKLYIADINERARVACEKRLRALGAPVEAVEGTAVEAAKKVVEKLDPYGLHFAFLDPFNLESLELEIIRTLASLRRMDILVHLSAMDIRRNAERYLSGTSDRFEKCAPGWAKVAKRNGTREEIFLGLLEHWKRQVDGIGMETSSGFHSMRNGQNQVIYWLLLLYRNDLAARFWNIVLKHKPNETRGLFD